MSTPTEARAELAAALQTAEVKAAGVRYYDDIAGTVDPPGVLIGPPQLEWETGCWEPTTARVVVHLAVAMTDRAMDRLLALLPVVTDALNDVPSAAVMSATPGVWNAGGTDLPCYDVLVEVAL